MPHPYIKPTITDPYPREFERVSDFNYDSPLVLARMPHVLVRRKLAGVSYIVFQDYTVSFSVDGEPTTLTVPRGMLTDLASVPRLARSFVGKVGPHLEASIVHDYLFIAWQLIDGREPRKVDFRFANAVMFAGLDKVDMRRSRRWAIKAALSFPWVAWSIFRDPNDKLFVDLDRNGA